MLKGGGRRSVLFVLASAAVAILTSCSALPTAFERRGHADGLAASKGWSPSVIATADFDLLVYGPPVVSGKTGLLTVYVEGDGFAWVTSSQPSDDPTPREPLALQLALAQPDGHAAYLSRPCQYTMNEKGVGRSCSQRYWTGGRFAAEVIKAENEALDELKRRYNARELVLVGYSGGGTVAALLAARRNDVVRLVTVAGNLDHDAWTKFHGAVPLKESLNAADEASSLRRIPQTHFVGGKDAVVPPTLARQFAKRLAHEQVQVIELSGFTHVCCWPQKWPELWSDLQLGR